MDDNENEDHLIVPVGHNYRNKTFACIAIAFLSFFVIICVHFEDIENYFGFNTCVNEIIIKDHIEIPDNDNNVSNSLGIILNLNICLSLFLLKVIFREKIS